MQNIKLKQEVVLWLVSLCTLYASYPHEKQKHGYIFPQLY